MTELSTANLPVAGSYARARARLGIASVSTTLFLAALALFLDLPARAFSHFSAGLMNDTLALLRMLVLCAGVSFTFDALGGLLLPRRHGRATAEPREWINLWGRATALHSLLLLGAALLVLQAGRQFGLLGAASCVAALMLVMVAIQFELAQLISGIRVTQRQLAHPLDLEIIVAQAADEDFAGGFSGLPGLERLVIPERWLARLPRDVLAVELERRRLELQDGSRTRGLALALAFNLLGFVVCALLPGAGVQSVVALINTSLWFTLWSFLGVLALPTLSRWGAHAADRLALPLSWACLGLLGRALHRNCGRPDLWIMLPRD